MRTFATSRSHLARCASNTSQLSKLCPAIAFFFTYPTPLSVLPFVRARYGAQARGEKPQCLANAMSLSLNWTVRLTASWRTTRARGLSISTSAGTPPKDVNALSRPVNQLACCSCRNARTCSRRECPSVATNTNALTLAPPISTNRSPKSDLQLPAWWRLEPRRRQRLGLHRLPIGLYRALHRPAAYAQALLGSQVLPHDIRIAAMPDEPLAQPILKPIEQLGPLGRLERHHTARRHVVLYRVVAATERAPNPLRTPPAHLQPQHLRHVVRRLHRLPPRIIAPRRASRDSLLVHSLSPQLSEEGAIPRDAEGAIFHGARHYLSTQAVAWPHR